MTRYSVNFTMEKQKCEITNDDGDRMVCSGYSVSYFKSLIFILLVLCSGGFLILLCCWRRDWYLKLRCSRCSLREAEYVILKASHHTTEVEEVRSQTVDGQAHRHLKLSLETNDDCAVSTEAERRPSEKEALLNVSSPRNNKFPVLRYFMHRHLKYVWNSTTGTFDLLRALDQNLTIKEIYDHASGLSTYDACSRKNIYGKNMIDVEVKSYGRLFLEQGLDPFYVFQLASVILWMCDNYYYYASAIIIISMGSLYISVHQTKKHLRNLRNMVAQSDVVKVLRNNGISEDVSSEDLVPGDVIVIPQHGAVMHCDAALISGNCIVNESMLTGESVPVTKTPLPQAPSKHGVPADEKPEIYSPKTHRRQTLFNGTKVIQTRYYGNAKVLAVVICTGFYTTKGDLIRSILNPRPVGFKFFRDSMRFIGFLAFLAMFGFGYSVYTFVKHGVATSDIIKKALDVITIAVPPALPAAMSVGTVYALQRLKKQQIYCIAPSRINMCGKLKLFCFDKTGTLTEDGLDILGVVAVQDNSFSMIISDASTLPKEPLLIAMATCHTLTVIDGELTGDPLDLKMFEATDWVLEEPGQDSEKFDTVIPVTVKPKNTEEFSMQSAMEGHPPFEVAILRQFPFSSDIQRMSVITRTLGANHMDVFVKGAPETVARLCNPETVPPQFHEELSNYTERGYRVIGLAHKPLGKKVTWHQAQRMQRDQVEKGLTFIGLLVMQNALKPETTPIIDTLLTANIRTVMATGDNMLTAVSVARECGMVGFNQKVIRVNNSPDDEKQLIWNVVGEMRQDSPLSDVTALQLNHRTRKPFHIATSGKTYAFIRDNKRELLNKLLLYGTVFARMSPEQKTHLVQDLQALDYCVGMCGDGANDCGALKAAHAGISLSEAEASIASPFTSKVPNIECVPKVIKEGRCALVTSFACFKYMALYSIVQFVSVLILYTIGSNLGDWQFLYIDLIIITSLALVMGNQHPYPMLVARRPGGSLVAPIVLFSLILQIAVQITVQVAGNEFVKMQPWFEAVNMSVVLASNDGVQIPCHQNTVLFTLTSFQYILLAVAFSRGKPYRLPIYRNLWFILVLVVLSAFSLFLALYDSKQPFKFFELLVLPDFDFRLYLLGFVAANFVASVIIEDCIIPSKCVADCLNVLRRKREPKNRYKRLEHEYHLDESWVPTARDQNHLES